MKRSRRLLIAGFVCFLPALALEVHGISLAGWQGHVGQTLIYNGFTTADGTSVQGSDVSPLRLTAGGGAVIQLAGRHHVWPQVSLYRQEYVALTKYPKVVPTQIETGSSVGEIAATLGLVVALPYTVHFRIPSWQAWEFAVGVSPTAVFRIPVRGIDGGNTGPVGSYFTASARWFMPELSLAGHYALSEQLLVGAVVRWMVPIYNAWAGEVDAGFLDEMLLFAGVSVVTRRVPSSTRSDAPPTD